MASTPKAFANFIRVGVVIAPTPKAFANFSPGLERQRQPWDRKPIRSNPERVRLINPKRNVRHIQRRTLSKTRDIHPETSRVCDILPGSRYT